MLVLIRGLAEGILARALQRSGLGRLHADGAHVVVDPEAVGRHNRIDTDEYSPEEMREIHDAAAGIAEAIANGQNIYNADAFWDFLDLTSLDAEDFPWEDFRDWYDGL